MASSGKSRDLSHKCSRKEISTIMNKNKWNNKESFRMGGTWICRHKDEGWQTFLLPVSPVCAFSPSPALFFLVAIHIQWCLYFPTCLGRILCQPSNLCQLCDHANPITVILRRARGQRPAATFPYNIYINKAFTASVSVCLNLFLVTEM